MLKKCLSIVTFLSVMVPLMASAASWSLATRALAPGGQIAVGADVQTAANGTVFKTLDSAASANVVVTAAAGYAIDTIKVNGGTGKPGGVTHTSPASPWSLSMTDTGAAQGVVVNFKASAASLTAVTIAAADDRGKSTPNGTFNVKPGSTASVSFQPVVGNTFTGITGVVAATTTLLADGTTKVTFVVPATAVTVTGNFAGTAHGTELPPTPVVVGPVGETTLQKATRECITCHSGAGVATVATAAYTAGSAHLVSGLACSGCHTDPVNGNHPGAAPAVCTPCHATKPVADPHAAAAHDAKGLCISCHSVGQNAGVGYVQDNNGVRSIMGEFTKRSHHITGGAPTNAQCVVCHLEGKVVNGAVVVDSAYHLKDANIYLRNADNNSAFAWDGSDHTAMDNFCFSCHDANGAAGLAAAGLNAITGGTASNPFGDTLTNSYDQVARAGVVDVKTAFTTTNASHHAVSGQRYKYRFSTAANAAAWAVKTGKPMPAASEIAEGHTDLDGNPIPASAFNNTNSAGVVGGGENKLTNKGMNDMTLFEAEKFVEAYIPLGASDSVGDNSLLHCGDCHTVGQWKAGSSMAADGSPAVAIGAHGSANEYLLRNSLGTDALHSAQTYICFSCHGIEGKAQVTLDANLALYQELLAEGEIAAIPNPLPTWKAGWGTTHPNVLAAQVEGYATAHAVVGFHAQCQVDSSLAIGAGTTVPLVAGTRTGLNNGGGHKDRYLDFLPAAGATAAFPLASAGDSGNVTGIACTNCHNSALRSGWGGIHGGDNTYTDGMGRTQKSYRFMPGMGNYRYAPPGGWDGKDVSDPQLVTLPGAGPGAGKPMGGCYTNGAAGSADMNQGFSSCSHHGTSTAAIPAGIIAVTGGSRTTLGGGTASNATAAEPTVRESSAGNVLVTRPLKY